MSKEFENAGEHRPATTPHSLERPTNAMASPENDNQTTKEEAKPETTVEKKRVKTPDLVEGKYNLCIDRPLSGFNSEIAKAYEVDDKKGVSMPTHYALVFNKNFQPRMQAINELRNVTNASFITPVAAEITYLSKLDEYRFVVILPKPPTKTLVDLIHEQGALTEEFVINQILQPLSPVFNTLETLGILHGKVNLSNIFINDRKQIILGECVSEPPGFSQPYLYETIERSKALPLGKGEIDPSADFYALGVVAYFLQKGKVPDDKADSDALIESKLMQGSFSSLIQNIVLSPLMMDLYRGLLHDKPSARWRSSQLRDFLKGKQFNLVRVPAQIEATRSIFFDEVQHFNRQSLSHALFKNWSLARSFLREDKLIKWIEGSVGSPEMAEQLRQIQKLTSTGNMKNAIFDANDELVARSLLILDPTGPLRVKAISTYPEALGNLLAQEFNKKSISSLQMISTFLKKNITRESSLDSEERRQPIPQSRLHDLVAEPGLGFGLERCLYELNPALPCQSSLLTKDYILTLNQILMTLDTLAEESTNYPVDKHIAAFIASRLNLTVDISLKSLADFPKFKTNQHIQTLALLAVAQKESGIKKLKGLSTAMGKQLVSAAEHINGIKYKNEFTDTITKLAKEGNLQLLYHFAVDPQLLIKDESGFAEAQNRYQSLATQLKKLGKRNSIANLGYHYGLRLAVMVAYLLCGLVFFFLVS